MKKSRLYISLGIAIGSLLVGWQLKNRYVGAMPLTSRPLSAPSSLAIWPLPHATQESLGHGITHWTSQGNDGTTIDFLDFDFGANPKLRWEIFDQDEDDEKPLDNHVYYWNRNVARATKELNVKGSVPVLAAWNGAFFGYNNKTKGEDAFHVSPVVLRGKSYFNGVNHRWTFGVKNTAQGPVWKVFYKPTRQQREREFDFAAGSVQCLVRNGKPLKVEPFPVTINDIKPQPVPSSPQEAGHIPLFDHMRTCRASLGWSRDNRHLYLLTVKEPDNEGSSSAALTLSLRGATLPGGMTLGGGWTTADVQRFWISKGVWGAINSDAGSVLQLVYRKPNSLYTFVPPRQETTIQRINCGPNWYGAVSGGGAMMYFLVREQP